MEGKRIQIKKQTISSGEVLKLMFDLYSQKIQRIICQVVAYAEYAATSPSITAQPLSFYVSGLITELIISRNINVLD
tara:strand:- start:204 stop:434 length:231 start_codon:yes stop_codon:yes gene_type:complete